MTAVQRTNFAPLARKQLSYAGKSLDWNTLRGSIMAAIVDQNCTIDAPTNLAIGQTYTLELHIESWNSPIITFDQIFLGMNQSAPSVRLNTAGGQVNVVQFTYNGTYLVPVSAVSYEYKVPWSNSLDATPNIATDFVSWRWWMHKRIGQFADKCPIERQVSYYVSYSTGNDSNDGLSESSPFKTLSKAQVVLDSGTDVRMRFKRGDEWRVASTGLTLSNGDTTIDDYGTGAKPRFSHFDKDYTSASWNQDASTNRYSIVEIAQIAAVRIISDPLGESSGTHLIRVASALDVVSTPYSWCWASNVLYVNLNGQSPNTLKVEGASQNSHSGIKINSGVSGVRVRNIRFDAFGCVGANGGYAIMAQSSINDAVYVELCDGYYSGTHIMGHLGTGTSGGKTLWAGCKAGLSTDPGGEALYIGYAALGLQEMWNVFWEATYGALKTSTWNYATDKNYGTAFASHTNGISPQMIVSYGGTVKQGITGCKKVTGIDQNDDSVITSVSDFTNCKAFEVYSTLEHRFAGCVNDWGDGRVKYGCHYYHTPYSTATFDGIHGSVAEVLRQYWINCYTEIDFGFQPTGFNLMAFFKGLDQSVKAVEAIHSWWKCVNLVNHDNGSAFNYDLWSDGTTNPGAGSSHTSKFINSMLTCDNAASFCSLALTNQATNVKNNAFYNIDQTAGKERGYDLGTGTVQLSSQPTLGTSHSQLLAAGSTTIKLSHDINGKPRTASTPDIGPEDFSSSHGSSSLSSRVSDLAFLL